MIQQLEDLIGGPDSCDDLFSDSESQVDGAAEGAAEKPRKQRSSNWGGARKGAGAKPAGYVKPKEVHDFDKAKARSESLKADRLEFDLAVDQKRYLPREAYIQASSKAVAAFTQAIRSIPDALEVRGVPPEVCVKVDDALTAALNDLADDLAKAVPAVIDEQLQFGGQHDQEDGEVEDV